MTTPNARSIGLLLVAIMAIASSAVLVRWAEAPAIALAFWRTLGGAVILAPRALAARNDRPKPLRSTELAILGAGVALALHFSTWLASLEMTSVAASVTLVSTAPIFVALIQWCFGGSRPTNRSWLVIGVTLLGIAIIAGGDIEIAASDELLGNGLALVGAAAMAVYLVLGGRVRSELSTAEYGATAYAAAAVALLPAALLTGTPLWGYDTQTWLIIGAMILGPQLAGHTVLNLLLERLGSLTVSLALLAEPIGASALTWLLLSEAPPLVAWIGSPVVLLGLALHLAWTPSQHQPVSG